MRSRPPLPFFSWFSPPRRLLLLFLAVTLIPAVGLVWMGWSLLQQDRALAAQRLQERREYAANLVVAALQQRLSESEQALANPALTRNSNPGDDALLVVFGPESLEAYPKDRLLYLPWTPPQPEAPEGLFRRGEEFEFRSQDTTRAIAGFRALLTSNDPAVRGGALLRIARNQRKAGRADEALETYRELSRLEMVVVAGVPAGLLARRARCALLVELKREAQLREEAQALYADLQRARWPIHREVYRVHAEEIAGWIGADRATEQERLAFAGAVEWLWERGSASPQGDFASTHRQNLELEGRSMTALWKRSPEGLAALIAGPRHLEQQWLVAVQAILSAQGVRLALKSEAGRLVSGIFPAADVPQTQRAAADTGLPWTLLVTGADPQAEMDEFAARRRLLLSGLILLVILVTAGSAVVGRAFARELAAARMQSDFVAAVSHEFRTPLASLRQLTENLAEGRVATEERRQGYYQAQMRATGRLHRLVEGLLDFGRMEADALRYRRETIDAAALVRATVEEFQQEVAGLGFTVELATGGASFHLLGDGEALARALWNLLDNAVKYSPDSRVIHVEAKRAGEALEIAVRDRGLGIDAREQQDVFHKFFRGAAAAATGAKGTGIGLAMVEHIVRAHGGTLRLQSAPGQGSTFTLRLPTGT